MAAQAVWDKRWLGAAKYFASFSKDPSTRLGAIIVGDRQRVLSLGWNGFPKGVADTEERLNDREIKYALVAHAERNALDQAECSVVGATLYVTAPPCNECAKSIIQRGIRRVVHSPASVEFMERWGKQFEFTKAMLEEAGVALYEFRGV